MATAEQDTGLLKLKHRVTGEVREVTQQQFQDENMDFNGWRAVNPLNNIEAQRRVNAPELDEDADEQESAGWDGTYQFDYDAATVEDLKARASDLDVSVKRGRGEDGPPLREDYVRALKRAERKAAKAAEL